MKIKPRYFNYLMTLSLYFNVLGLSSQTNITKSVLSNGGKILLKEATQNESNYRSILIAGNINNNLERAGIRFWHTLVINPIPSLKLKIIKSDRKITVLFPNPTKIRHYIKIILDPQFPVVLILKDLQGRTIKTKSNPSPQFYYRMDLTNQTDGIYILTLENGLKIQSHRIIKMS